MYNSLLNNFMRNYRNPYAFHYNSQSVRYLTPCETLNEYLNDPCSIFNGSIVPTGPMPPEPPLPPIPPIIPGVIDNLGIFLAPTASLTDGLVFSFNTLEIKGDAIQHVDGSGDITLAPNRTYMYAWISQIEVFTPNVVTAGAELLLEGAPVPGSQRTFTGPGNASVRELEAMGQIITGNNEEVLNLVYLTSDNTVNNRVNATLTIFEITP